MVGVEGCVERAMLVLKTRSVVGERWSRMESMKVIVPRVLGLVKGTIYGGRRWKAGDYMWRKG